MTAYLFSTITSSNLYALSPNNMLAVVEENAGHVNFYNPKDGKSLGELQIGYLPHEIALSPDGKTAYVSNFGIKDYDSGAGRPGTSISVIDIPSRTEKYRLYTFDPAEHKNFDQIDSAPHGIKLRPSSNNLLYVNIEKGNKVLVFNLDTNSIIKKFDVSPNTHNMLFSADGKILWLMAGRDGIFRIDPDTGKITGNLTLTTPVRGLKFTPDQQYLMASAYNQVVLVDPIKLSIVKQFDNLGVGQILYSDMTPDQKYIIAPAAFDNQVVIIDVQTGKIVKRIVTGLNPVSVILSPSGKYAYVTNATDNHITKINLTTLSSKMIHTHDGPNGTTFVPFQTKVTHKKLVLGTVLPLSGQDAQKGRDMMRGYEYWRLMIEQAGGLYIGNTSYDVKIVYLDSQSDSSTITNLTNELVDKYHATILLSTYGLSSYNVMKNISLQKHIPLTPAQNNDSPWQPNEIAAGQDFFVTSKEYDQQYYRQYNFKASNYSASATAIGIVLQKALSDTKNFDYDTLTKAFEQNKFHVFYNF